MRPHLRSGHALSRQSRKCWRILADLAISERDGKSNLVLNLPNCGGLVVGCIEADFLQIIGVNSEIVQTHLEIVSPETNEATRDR